MNRRIRVSVTMLMVFFISWSIIGTLAEAGEPRYGGILREIWYTGPRVLSYLPEMGPGDEQAIMPAAEKLMEYTADHKLEPFLAESVTVAPDGKQITFKLRKGIKFTDGSELTAEVVAWNYQINIDAKRLQYRNKLEKMEVVDKYTLIFHLTNYNNQMLHSLGWVPIFSKVAWDNAANGDFEKGKEFARANIVATGPFKLAEYKRDNYVKWVKNESYWQKGKPYLDGILVRIIPDSVTASALMLAKEADMWVQPPVNNQAEFEKMGFIRHSGYGLPRMIYLNNKDPQSKFKNKKLREAVEYAIDKVAIAKALGFGYYTPLTMVAPPGEWGYDPNYKGRSYNPEKAKQLLAEAGYAEGLTIKMMALSNPPWPDELTSIKRYLDEVGIRVESDLADPGRFFGSVYMQGWKDSVLWLTGMDPNYLITFHRQFGPEPMANYASFERSPELMALAEKSLQLQSDAEQEAITKDLVRLMADEAVVIPLYRAPSAYIIQPYVHTTFLQELMVARLTYNEWMDEH